MDLFVQIAIIAAGIVVGIFIAYALIAYFKKIVRRTTEHGVGIKLIQLISLPFIFLIVLIAGSTLFSATKLSDQLDVDTSIIGGILYIISLSWLIINAIRGIKVYVLAKYDISTKNNLKARKIHTQLSVLERMLIAIVILIATAIILMTIPQIRKVGVSLLASAGIAGIIIGFAAQKSIALILAGFQIAVTQPIRLEDVVIVEEEWGWIEEITLTYVVVRIWDKRRLIVPITHFIEKPFQNWTRTSAEIMGTIYIYVDYGFPVEAMRQKLTAILEETPLWDRQVNVLQVTNLNEKSMELRALVSASDSPTAWDLRVYVREQLIRFLQEEYPQFLPKGRVYLENQPETRR
ncbi:mechanosensitive ion channel family protein [Sunxiuqinia elliptica]|uniref:Small-conductance mechanosensitive channel n=1 Tax=Sunxiuqinia elliptica TaxID=655355 RepID=A0A1I2GTP5_9BACT|nr:mechanosensitive ion channel domain-containing protein [Sunxiuqinia elliptica]SFF21314.1 Small-conductance mechanosensitive channel [Sunxiuqinia elliptica]